MNILQINNYGYIRGGSDRYFIDIYNLLKKNGHSIECLVSSHKKNIIGSRHVVPGFDVDSPSPLNVPKFIYSLNAQKQLRLIFEKIVYDVAHLHIYYGQITASILPVLKAYGIPVIQTLHEYKLLCPVSTMVRDGRICELCAGGRCWHAVRHRCNRGSLLRSLASTVESYVSTMLGARKSIDHFIAVSDFLRRKMIEYGIPENKITTVHNFVRDEIFAENRAVGRYFLYFGRLEKIKGIETLIKAMERLPDVELLIVGEGGGRALFEEQVRNAGLGNVHFLGFKSGQSLRELIGGAIAIVVPSEWYETFGLVLIESMAQCRPVIASRIGGMPEVVSEGIDGLLFDAGNVEQLASAMAWMASNRKKAVEMGKAGQEKVRRLFSAEKHYQDVMQVYKKVVRV